MNGFAAVIEDEHAAKLAVMDCRMIMIKDVNPTVVKFGLKVKVLRIEEQDGSRQYEAGEKIFAIIVSDEEGNRIGIHARQRLRTKFLNFSLAEDQFYVVKHLNVCDNERKGRSIHWTHAYKLMVTHKTSFQPLPQAEWAGPTGFKYVPFSNIITKVIKEGDTVDLIGRVHHYDPIKHGSSTRKNFDVMDLSGKLLSCTLWGKFATNFDAYMKKNGTYNSVIIIIQFGRINNHDGKLTVSTDWTFSKVLLNTDDPAILNFRSGLANLHGEGNESLTLAPALTPITKDWFKECKHAKLKELQPDNLGMFVVHAEILSVLSSPTWYYIACKKCNKKAVPKDSVVDLTMDVDSQLSRQYDCTSPKCERSEIKVAVRFKVPVRVFNKTGNASLTLFESDIEKYITKSAYELLKEMADDQDVPDEFDDLIGKRMLFKVHVRDFYNGKGSTNYTVNSTRCDLESIKLFREEYGLCEDDDWEVVDAEKGGYSLHVGSTSMVQSSGNGDCIETVDLGRNVEDTPPAKRIKQEKVEPKI